MNLDEDLSKVLLHAKSAKDSTETSDHASAAGAYKQACILLESNLIRLRCSQARSLLSAEEYTEAKQVTECALRFAPKDPTALYLNASALLHLGFRTDAKATFNTAATYETDLATKTSYMDWAARCDGPVKLTPEAPNSLHQAREACASSPSVPKDNTRMQWYQSATHVNVDVFAKNVIKDDSCVSFSETQLTVRLKRPDMDTYSMDVNLFGKIDAVGSTWSVSKVKVEIRLKKKEEGASWKTLDSSAEVISAAAEAKSNSARRLVETQARQKEWDSVAENELKDYKEDDSSMSLFKAIYKDADDDTRRAMMKSYSESGGQVLSTNWDEVKKKKVVYEGTD